MEQQTQQDVPVWDIVVRLCHWLLAACVFINLFGLTEEGEQWHRYVGYTAAAVVAVRLVWGFVGSRYARFGDFFPTPSRIKQHVQAMLRPTEQAEVHLGHNPLGAVMMFALWAVVIGLGVTGYLMGTDAFWGEEWLEEIHEVLANSLWILVPLHVLAAVVMSVKTKVNLPRAMVTGKKRLPTRPESSS